MQTETIEKIANRGMPFGRFVATATKSAAMGFSGIVGSGFNLVGEGVKTATGLGRNSIIENLREEQYLKSFGKGAHTKIDFENTANGTSVKRLETVGQSKLNLFKSEGKSALKSFGISTAITGGLYGLSAVMTDDNTRPGGERFAHYGRHAIAGTIDTASDLGLGAVGLGLSMLGPYGALAGTALNVFNMGAGFLGMDAGSLAMNFMNMADEEYEKRSQGSKFEMTANSSMAMQRQIQNLHASGSNLGEMMHN